MKARQSLAGVYAHGFEYLGPIFSALLLLSTVFAGCRTQTAFHSSSEDVAIERLNELLPISSAQITLLRHGLRDDKRSEFWCFISAVEPVPSSFTPTQRPEQCPLDSVFSFALSLGVEPKHLVPPGLLEGQEESVTQDTASSDNLRQQFLHGKIWFWSASGYSVRMRTAPTGQDRFLAVVERLDEAP